MKKFIAIILTICLLLSCACGKGGGETTETPGTGSSVTEGKDNVEILKPGQSAYQIVIPSNASEVEQYAASEFAVFFEKCTDMMLSIIRDNTPVTAEKYISIGKTSKLTTSGIKVDYDVLKQDGFIIEVLSNGNIYLEGGKRGVLYSAYDFLERFFGVKFLSVSETITPKVTSLTIKNTRIVEIPAFRGRDPHFYEPRQNGDFAARIRTNGVDMPLEAKHGGGLHDEYSDYWAHTVLELLPYSIYGAEHSDWYREDTRFSTPGNFRGQICFTKEAVRLEVTKNLKQWITGKPSAKYFMIGQDDVCPLCICSTCSAAYKTYTKAGVLIRFINAIAEDIENWQKTACPDRELYISTLAYQETQSPPTKRVGNQIQAIDPSVIPRDNVIIRMTDIESCFSHSLLDKSCTLNLTFQNDFEGWKTITKEMFLWSYCTNFSNYLLPFPNYNATKQNYIDMYESGITEFLDQGVFNTPRGEFSELRQYVQAKMMWNPYQDMNALIDEFIEGFYKEGSQYIKEYWKLITSHYATLDMGSTRFHAQLYNSLSPTKTANFPKRLLEQMNELTMKAYSSYDSYSDKTKKDEMQSRALALSLSSRYLQLINYSAYYGTDGKNAFADSFFADAERVGLTRFSEGDTLEALKAIIYG